MDIEYLKYGWISCTIYLYCGAKKHKRMAVRRDYREYPGGAAAGRPRPSRHYYISSYIGHIILPEIRPICIYTLIVLYIKLPITAHKLVRSSLVDKG